MQTSTKIILGAALVWFLFARKGSAMTFTSSGAVGGINFFNQSDPRWKDKHVGTGNGTYGEIGCVTTAVCIAVDALKNRGYTPTDFQPGGAAGLDASDYTGGSIKSDQVFAKLGCVVRNRITGVPRPSGIQQMKALIENALMNGGLALLRVDYDFTKAGDNHTVVCFARDASGFKCADPAGGANITLDENLFVQRTSTKSYSVVGVQPVYAG